MTSVPVGSRVLLRSSTGSATLRVLHEAVLDAEWSIPVIGLASALQHGAATFELVTDGGPLTVEGYLHLTRSGLTLRPGPRPAEADSAPEPVPALQQRREYVRAAVRLPLRGAAVDAVSRNAVAEAVLTGSTVSVSAGGVCAELRSASTIPTAARLYLELELPGGQLAPTVVSVVEGSAGWLRAQFVDIAPIDRERLVRLVFARQREELAQRRRLLDAQREGQATPT